MKSARWRSDSVLVPMRFPVSVLAVAMLALGGCTREPEPSPAPDALAVAPPDSVAAEPPAPDPFPAFARRATAIELALDDYHRIEGTWQTGDASSTFTAYFAGDALQLLEETRLLGEAGRETNVYYFADGALFYTVQDAVYTRPGRAGEAQRDTVRLRMAFTPAGEVHASEGTVNGEREAVQPALVEGVRSHAEALQRRARERRRGAPAT